MSQSTHAPPNETHSRSKTRESIGNRPKSPEDIQTAYEDIADKTQKYDWLDRFITGSYRRKQFSDIEGPVLDVACGTGTNFYYLPDDIDLVGIDISPEMLCNADETLDELNRSAELYQMNAQSMDFPDDHFQTVISALSTCTFPDPVEAIREMARVCSPDGRIHLFEHGRSDARPLAWFQEYREEAHYENTGCRWTQEPLDIVEESGVTIESVETSFFGIITTIQATPNNDSP